MAITQDQMELVEEILAGYELGFITAETALEDLQNVMEGN